MNVEEYFEWREHLSNCNIEAQHKKNTNALDWKDDIDVMYSFLGIYAIGVWVYNKNNSNFKITKYFIFAGPKNKQRLYSSSFLKKLQNEKIFDIDVSELNNNESLKKFLNVYQTIGNLIPLWPGGNTKKGKEHGCFDIPELFFNRHFEWFKVLKKIYKINGCLDCVKPEEKKYKSLNDFLNSISTIKDYTNFLNCIVDNINKRNDSLNNILNSKEK